MRNEVPSEPSQLAAVASVGGALAAVDAVRYNMNKRTLS